MKPILIYDDSCELCNNLVKYLNKKDNQLSTKIELLESSKLRSHSTRILTNKDNVNKSIHFIVDNNTILTQIPAIQKICGTVGIFPFFSSIKSPFLIAILNVFYRGIAYFRKTYVISLLGRLLFRVLR